jgi:uncharacterized membrane protein (TIGR01666 family)
MKWLKLKNQLVYFFLGEYFTDAVRTTFSIILPVWVLFTLQLPQIAIAVGLGALLITMTDLPGIFKDKLTGSITSILLLLFVAAVTCMVRPYSWPLGAAIVTFCFLLSMLTVLGNRYAMIGTAGIILMIFTIGLKPANGIIYCSCIFAGSIWYYLVSLLQAKIWPLRSLKHAIIECLTTTSVFMKIRQSFYNPDVPLPEAYSRTIAMHALVNEKHEQVRQLLLRDSSVMNTRNVNGQKLLHVASLAIDLYEHIGAINYDYKTLRENFKSSGTLELISRMIALLADELDGISRALLANRNYESRFDHNADLKIIEGKLEHIIKQESALNAPVLISLKDNLQNIRQHINNIKGTIAQQTPLLLEHYPQPDYKDLITPQQAGLAMIKENLTIHSPVFRFSLRLAIACLFGYLLTFVFNLGNYSYWILLTIVVVMKPAFSITKKRNMERLGGTLVGVAAGLLILWLTNEASVQLTLSVVLLVGFFTFIRLNYTVSVMCLTTMVVLCLSIYGGHRNGFIAERLYDTLIGCAIAYAAAYVFPVWEVKKLYNFMIDVLNANTRYLEVLFNDLSGQPTGTTAYKLARKNVYAKLANLSSAYQRMLAEPHHVNEGLVSNFQMLNHTLCSLTASYFPLYRSKAFTGGNNLQFEVLKQAMNELKSCLVSFPARPQEKLIVDNPVESFLLLNNMQTAPDNFVTGIINNIKQCTKQLLNDEN